MTEANVETGKQIIPTISKVLKKYHFFFQHYLRNQSAKDRTVKLYRRPRSFMHPVWMRVSGLIFGHWCVSRVYKARLFFCSPLDSMKLWADSQVLLICIQPECRGSSACSWCQAVVHQGTRRHFYRDLCSSGLCERILMCAKGCENLAKGCRSNAWCIRGHWWNSRKTLLRVCSAPSSFL